jgi:hypothetical protein
MNRGGKDKDKQPRGEVASTLDLHFADRHAKRRASVARTANETALASFDERETPESDAQRKIDKIATDGGPAELIDLLIDAGLDPADHFDEAWAHVCASRSSR